MNTICHFLIILIVLQRCNSRDSRGLFITLSFDDNLIEHYQAGELLSKYGMRGTFYINSGRLSTTQNYLSRENAQNLQLMNHEIGGHTINHINLLTASNSQRKKQICNDKKNLEDIGLKISSFAFPFGADFNNAQQILRDCGYLSARDSGGILTPTSCNGCPTFLNFPLSEPYAIRSISYRIDSGNEQIIDIINKAQNDVNQNNAFGWLIFIFHEIGNLPNSPTSITLENLERLLEYIQNQNSIAIVTTNQITEPSVNFEKLFNDNKITSSTTMSSGVTQTPVPITIYTSTLSNPAETSIIPQTNSSSIAINENNAQIIGTTIGLVIIMVFILALCMFRCLHEECGMCSSYDMDRCGLFCNKKITRIKNILSRRIIISNENIEMDVFEYVENGYRMSIQSQFELNSIVLQ